jgi:hypothetical protein
MKGICVYICAALIGGVSLSSCHRILTQPEKSDPIYLDISKDAESTAMELASLEKSIDKAKTAYDQAPIRTGLRSDARDEYFQLLSKKQLLLEKYRYLAIKAEIQQRNDRKTYIEALKDKKPWPNPEEITEFQVHKSLESAPREWDAEARVRKRALASLKTKASSENSHSEEAEHH